MKFLQILTLTCLIVNSYYCREFQLLNNYGQTLWVGIQGNPGHPHLEGGGVALEPNQRSSINSEENWAGRFWGRTGCDSNSGQCVTGDCGSGLKCNGKGGKPPASLAEITLNGANGLDYYDISLVDGFNIPISIEPLGGQGDGGQYSCKKAGCDADINGQCPDELKLQNNGQVVGCNSACNAFNTDQYCCRGQYDKPETCQSSSWPVNYPAFFKNQCPDAYSYAYDDHKSTFTCNAPSYLITFG